MAEDALPDYRSTLYAGVFGARATTFSHSPKEASRDNHMSYVQEQFAIKKPSRLPWIVAGIVAVVLAVAAGVAFTQRSHRTVVFGDTLKVHFEPAMAGEQKLIEYVSDKIAPDYGIKLEAVGLQDPAQADRAVADGTYAGTIYQHQWWLKQVVDANGFALTATLPVFQWGFGLYSDRYKSISDVPNGATFVVPNDGANQGQALWLLARIGLIGLNKNIEPRVAKLRDVSSNPHHYVFKELDLLSEPRVLDSVDVAIGYTAQFDAGKVPRSKGILFPHAPRTFASQLVIGTPYLGDPQIEKLKKAFSDPRVQQYLQTTSDPLVHGVLTPVSAGSSNE